MFRVDRLNAYYGKVQVLWDVSLTVGKGEIVALIGANGAGKSTALKSMVNVLTTKDGFVTYAGKDITRTPAHAMAELGIAYVPEGRRVFPDMTVYENLKMGAYHKRAKQKFQETLAWIYSIFPRLEERQRQLAGTLSGGEQQMLAIGRGLMSRPSMLLLDEPSLGIAPVLVREIFKKIEAINRQGISVLLVEQHVHHALRLCHRAYVMENGRIVLSGTGEELLQNDAVREAYLGI